MCILFFAAEAHSAGPDLIIESISHTPETPRPNDLVTFTVSVKNQSATSTLVPFSIGFWSNLGQAPLVSSTPEQSTIGTILLSGQSAQYVFVLTAPADGTYSAWAFADKLAAISESDETNNAGPAPAGHAWTVATPLVSIVADDATSSEPGTDTGSFLITRSGSTTEAVTVLFVVSGSASNGSDYAAVSGSVSIPSGSSSAQILIFPIDDNLSEASETVTLALLPSLSYSIGNPSSATLTIADDDFAPNITSPLTATGTIGADFSYTITASGSAPIVFNATGLPSGLTFAGDKIFGVPQQSGASDITLSATNTVGSDTKILRLSVTDPSRTNTAPRISSLPQALPNPAKISETVTFSVSAEDEDSLVYTWDFADGTQATGASVTHAFAAAGVYTVRVIVSDGELSDNASLYVLVNEEGDTGSTVNPITRIPNKFVVRKASLRFNLKVQQKDYIVLSGYLPVNFGLQLNGAAVTFSVANVSRSMALSARGRGGDKLNNFKLSGKMKNGAVIATPMKFLFSIRNQNLAAEFEDYIFKNSDGTFMIEAPVVITIGSADFQVDVVRFTYNPVTGSALPTRSK